MTTFLDLVRKTAQERKERLIQKAREERQEVEKGGKGSGWFGPPKGTHTKGAKAGAKKTGKQGRQGAKGKTMAGESRTKLSRAASEQRQKIAGALSNKEWRSAQDIAGRSGLSMSVVGSSMAELQLKGKVESKREGFNFYYRAKGGAKGKSNAGSVPKGWERLGSHKYIFHKKEGKRSVAISPTSWGSWKTVFGQGVGAEERAYDTKEEAIKAGESYLRGKYVR